MYKLLILIIPIILGGCKFETDKVEQIENITIYNGDIPDNIDSYKSLKKVFFELNCKGVVPHSVFEDKAINYLKFNDGNLTGFDCKYFKSLDTLILSRNKIDIVMNINEDTVLKYIDFSGNRIQLIDFNVFKYNKSISYIDLSYNFLKEFPCSLIEIKSLKVLNLSTNRISQIPKEISNFSGLVELNISNNLITDLPDEIFSLKNLRVLKVDRNYLSHDKIDILKSKMPLLEIVY